MNVSSSPLAQLQSAEVLYPGGHCAACGKAAQLWIAEKFFCGDSCYGSWLGRCSPSPAPPPPLTDKAIKYDSQKRRYDLLPGHALDELVKVYTFGASKYAARNWELGMSYSRIFGAIMRHAWDWFRGQDYDTETGLHNMAQAAWGCLALVEYHHSRKGEDDRVKITGAKI